MITLRQALDKLADCLSDTNPDLVEKQHAQEGLIHIMKANLDRITTGQVMDLGMCCDEEIDRRLEEEDAYHKAGGVIS